jgi:hypothetical protein
MAAYGRCVKEVSLSIKFNAHRAAIRASPLRRADLICLASFAIIPANQSFVTAHFSGHINNHAVK